MATRKIVRRKKKKFELFAFTVFFVVGVAYLLTSIFVRSYNVTINKQTQSIENQIIALESDNAQLYMEVQQLIAKDKVVEVAQEDGMTQDQDNIVYIDRGE